MQRIGLSKCKMHMAAAKCKGHMGFDKCRIHICDSPSLKNTRTSQKASPGRAFAKTQIAIWAGRGGLAWPPQRSTCEKHTIKQTNKQTNNQTNT